MTKIHLHIENCAKCPDKYGKLLSLFYYVLLHLNQYKDLRHEFLLLLVMVLVMVLVNIYFFYVYIQII